MCYPSLFPEDVDKPKIKNSNQFKIFVCIKNDFITDLYPKSFSLTFKIFVIDFQDIKGPV